MSCRHSYYDAAYPNRICWLYRDECPFKTPNERTCNRAIRLSEQTYDRGKRKNAKTKPMCRLRQLRRGAENLQAEVQTSASGTRVPVILSRPRKGEAKMKTDIHFSRKTIIWETPQDVFDALNNEFNFKTDVCALPQNAKCADYYTPEQDELKQKWSGACWMNPPYGREIVKWVKKAHESAQAGATVVCLLPARTDTSWWHEYVMRAAEIRFIRGRLKFSGSKINAPFPSAVAIFIPTQEGKP